MNSNGNLGSYFDNPASRKLKIVSGIVRASGKPNTQASFWKLTLGSIGVVYGDIGATFGAPLGSPVVDPFDLPKPPVRKENKLVGAFVLYRTEVRPFTEKLVQNFAAQA